MKKLTIIFIMLSSMLFSQTDEKSISTNENLNKKEIQAINECTKEAPCQQVVDTTCCCPKCPVGLSFAFKAGYFWPQEKIYRRIYDGGFMPLFEMCYDFCRCKGFGLFSEVGYFYKSTDVRSVDIVVDTNVTTVPFSLGLSYTFKTYSWLDIYFKIGPNYVYTQTSIDIPELKEKVSKNSFGGTIGTGLKFDLCSGAFLEVYANYLFNRKKIHDKISEIKFKVYLGGIQTGVGLGYKF